MIAIQDQLAAGLDVITDGEQTRFDFNSSCYGYIDGIARDDPGSRRYGPPAPYPRGKQQITGHLPSPSRLGGV